MNDLRLPGLLPSLAGARADGPGTARSAAVRGAPAAEGSGFDQALQRSADRDGERQEADRLRDRRSERTPPAAPDRSAISDEARLAQRRADERAADRSDERTAQSAQERSSDRSNERDAQADRSNGSTARSTDGGRGPARSAEPAAERRDTASTDDAGDDGKAATADADRPADATAVPTDTAARSVPADPDPLALLGARLAASAWGAGRGNAAGSPAADVGTAAAADAPAATATDDAAATGSAARKPQSALFGADDSGSARGSRAALPELSADLTRTPAKDRLLEDFERRFENSLARAVGNAAPPAPGPLAAAGLPPQLAGSVSAPAVAAASVHSPIGHPSFGDELSHRVLLFAGQRVERAEITVSPPDLGPISVSIEVRGQEAAMQFSASHATTRAAIEDALPRLREMLAAQGLQLSQADVGDRRPRESSSGYGNGASNGSGTGSGGNGEGGGRGAATGAGGASAPTVRRIGLIDIRV